MTYLTRLKIIILTDVQFAFHVFVRVDCDTSRRVFFRLRSFRTGKLLVLFWYRRRWWERETEREWVSWESREECVDEVCPEAARRIANIFRRNVSRPKCQYSVERIWRRPVNMVYYNNNIMFQNKTTICADSDRYVIYIYSKHQLKRKYNKNNVIYTKNN